MTDAHMTPDERRAFLAEARVAVLAVDEPGRGPLALPIWYLLDGDDLVFSMDGTSRKADLLGAAGRATATVQDEALPYKYVSVEGPVDIGPPRHEVLELAVRYLGDELGRLYADANPRTDTSVEVRLRPEHWRTHDFAKDLAG